MVARNVPFVRLWYAFRYAYQRIGHRDYLHAVLEETNQTRSIWMYGFYTGNGANEPDHLHFTYELKVRSSHTKLPCNLWGDRFATISSYYSKLKSQTLVGVVLVKQLVWCLLRCLLILRWKKLKEENRNILCLFKIQRIVVNTGAWKGSFEYVIFTLRSRYNVCNLYTND